MSKGELGKGVAIRLITAAVFGVIGFGAIYYALQMVAIFGEGMGVDARSREIYAHSHMVVHIFGAASALAIGVFYYGRNWLLFTFAILAIVTCGSYGILNMVGFTSTNRVSVAASKDATKDAAERAYDNARADLQAQIKWLQNTAADEVGRERRRLLSEVNAKRKELSALKPPVPTAETVLSDPQATTLAELTGTSSRQWLLALPIPLAVLLFFAESFSFVVVGHMLAAIVAMVASYVASLASSPKGGSGDGGESVKSSDASTDKQPAREAEIHRLPVRADQLQTTPKVSSDPPRVPVIAPRPPVPLTLKPIYASVEDFLARHPSVTSQKVIADAMGVSQAKVSRDIKRLKGRGKVKAEKNWRSNAITFTPRRNGGLHAVI